MGDYNFSAVVIGPPQYGKTTIVKGLVEQHLRAHPTGLALVHDPNRQFRDLCATYDDSAAWLAALTRAADEGKPFPRGASIGGKASALRDAVVAIGKRRNSAGNVRLPMLLAYDESSLMGSSGSSYISEDDNALLSNRRHWGIGTVYNVQRPTALTEAFYSLATDVFILAQPSERRTSIVEEYLGLRPGSLRSLVGGGPFRFAHWKSGKGLV